MIASPLTASGARHFAVIGSPIAHSLSPALHRAAYASLGIADADYARYEVTGETFPEFIAEHSPTHHGFSVTMPCKPHALEWADRTDDLAELTGAANTLVREEDGSWSAYNRDVYGIVTALRRTGLTSAARGALIGSGSTAASALVALASLGCTEVAVVARSARSAATLDPIAERLGVSLSVRPFAEAESAFTADALVSTVPGRAGAAVAETLSGRDSPLTCSVLDVVYDPFPSPLLQAVSARGGETVSGLEMLLHQAVAQVDLMTGSLPDEAPMRAAMLAELGARAQAPGD